MPRHYASFLIRCWHLESQGERIRVEHVQSGETAQFDSLEALIAWIEKFWQEQPGGDPPEPDQTPSSKE